MSKEILPDPLDGIEPEDGPRNVSEETASSDVDFDDGSIETVVQAPLNSASPASEAGRQPPSHMSRNGHAPRQALRAVRATASRPNRIGMQNAAALTAEYELMEALAETAAAAKGRAEATHLVAAMPALAAQLVSRYRREIWPLLPVLIEGTVEVTRLLHAAVVSRPYIRLLPVILLRTVMKLAEAAADGKEPTREAAADTLADCTGAILQKHYRTNRTGGFRPGGSR